MGLRPNLDQIEETILALCNARDEGATICPTEAAKAIAASEGCADEWRSLLTSVRQAAIALALSDRITIYRKGKPADPSAFKGVYRLGIGPARTAE